jgi:hypothetical protein
MKAATAAVSKGVFGMNESSSSAMIVPWLTLKEE